jgi:predicted membrane channel-forming protein YqfA (hemolysin III family)
MFELISATICSLHFMFHDFETLRYNYVMFYLILGIGTVVLSSLDFFISAKLNMFLMLLYATLFMLSFMSSLHWVAIANPIEIAEVAKYIMAGFLFMFIGFVMFLAKFPECYIQNKMVDYFFQSHTMWHICGAGCVTCYYLMMYNYYLLIKHPTTNNLK